MQCRRCLSTVTPGASFCDQCGSPTHPQDQPDRRALPILAGVTVALVVGGILLFLIYPRVPARKYDGTPATRTVVKVNEPDGAGAKGGRDKHGSTANAGDSKSAAGRPADGSGAKPAKLELLSGVARVFSLWDDKLGEYPASIVQGEWFALPYRACLGGHRLEFKLSEDLATPIVGTMWHEQEEIVYWQLDDPAESALIEVRAWSPGDDLTWLSYAGERIDGVRVGAPLDASGYARVPLPEPIAGKWGVFVQESRVVGWSFGTLLADGWLLTERRPAPLAFDMTPDQFYRITFGGGREEKFANALAVTGKASLEEQLALICEGFRLPAKLSAEETPMTLARATLTRVLRNLVNELARAGKLPEALRELDAVTLREAEDVELLLLVLDLLRSVEGPGVALERLHEVSPAWANLELAGEAQLMRLERELYLAWIEALVNAGDLSAASRAWADARTYFPDDGEIHLVGAEIAIAGGDWQQAEQILAQRRFIGELAARARAITDEIRRLKLPDGKIVIRFPPGSHSIRSSAILNGSVTQDYIVDTGATTTTLPVAAADALGVRITAQTPRRKVNTAGGDVLAPEVVLDSINLQGAEVASITVLVLDLPAEPGVGLIGINFLRNFNVDLRTDDGPLLLEPK